MKDPLHAVSMHRGNERALCVIDRPCPRKCYVRLKYADELLQNDMDTIINVDRYGNRKYQVDYELLQNDMDTIINLDNKPEVLADA